MAEYYELPREKHFYGCEFYETLRQFHFDSCEFHKTGCKFYLYMTEFHELLSEKQETLSWFQLELSGFHK